MSAARTARRIAAKAYNSLASNPLPEPAGGRALAHFRDSANSDWSKWTCACEDCVKIRAIMVERAERAAKRGAGR